MKETGERGGRTAVQSRLDGQILAKCETETQREGDAYCDKGRHVQGPLWPQFPMCTEPRLTSDYHDTLNVSWVLCLKNRIKK